LNLAELKQNIDFEIENLNSNNKNSKDVIVLITLNESCMGARASSGIKYIGMGFDWESGQLRIEPVKNLVSKGNSLIDIKEAITMTFDGKKYYICSKCGNKISKNDNYCRHCSQKLK